MKILRTLLLALAGSAAAAPAPMHWEMPSTGMLPSHLNVEYASRMAKRHGGADLAWSAYNFTIPFLDPRKSNWGSWMVDAHMDVSATIFSTGGELNLRRDELYSASVPFSLIRPEPNGNLWVLSLAPSVASDFAGTERFYDVVGAAMYTIEVNKSFNYTIGLAAAPRFLSYGVMPVLSFSWQMAPEWELRFQRFQLSMLYRYGERLQVGPFAAMRGGAWMVTTDEGDRIFRINSLVTGLTAEYDFHREGQRKRIIYASFGSTLVTKMQYCQRNFSKESLESHNYKPGLYITVGADFRF